MGTEILTFNNLYLSGSHSGFDYWVDKFSVCFEITTSPLPAVDKKTFS